MSFREPAAVTFAKEGSMPLCSIIRLETIRCSKVPPMTLPILGHSENVRNGTITYVEVTHPRG